MTFLNPLAFLGLAALAPVILLYFLKLRRRRVTVSSTWLWERAIQDYQVNAPFQRLRRSLLLLLQLLLLALAVVALASPAGRASPPRGKRWAILLDRSASMQMKDAPPSRLEVARKMAGDVIDGAGPDDEVMVVAFGDRAEILTPLTSSRRRAREAVDAVAPHDTATDAREAFRLAASALGPHAEREIVVFSDGGFDPVEMPAADITVRYVPIGGTPRNAAITALDVRAPVRADDPWTVFANVELFGDSPASVPVELYVDGGLKAVKRVELAPGPGKAVLFEIPRSEPEIVEVRLGWDDDLAADNRALYAARRKKPRVLVATAGNFFLERAVAAQPGVEALSARDFASLAPAEDDVVILDGESPASLPEGRYLLLGAVPPWEGFRAEGDMKEPGIVDWDRRHPVARHIDFLGLYIQKAVRLAAPPVAVPLVESRDAPLIVAYERGKTRAVVVAFRPLESDWPLRLSFPLFVANALEWLRGASAAAGSPGAPLRFVLGADEREIAVAAPDGRRVKLEGTPGSEVVFGETARAGLYTAVRAAGETRVALNLMNALESAGRVAPELRLASGKSVSGAALARPPERWWRGFALAALALLLLEWFVYHRRVEL